jgi:SAM-dependent methyltransferase
MDMGTLTRLGPDELGELGALAPLELAHPAGTFALTIASRTALRAVAEHRRELGGIGIDWGSGVGALAILAAKASGVERVVGLELSPADVEVARANAVRNGVAERCRFVVADSYVPLDAGERAELDALRGKVDFLLSNPPASTGDDGLGIRRRVRAEGRAFLRPGAPVFLSISSQFGMERIRGLEQDAPGFRWRGVLVTTELVPFDASRPDLRANLELYAAEEARGGRPYDFRLPAGSAGDARAALAHFHSTGASPLSRWQVHCFVRE